MRKDWAGPNDTARRLRFFSFPLLSICLVPCLALAQSGRAPKRGNSPTIVPTVGVPAAAKAPEPSKLSLIVVDYIPSPNVAVETGWVYRSFVQRLKESARVAAAGQNEMRRKDAIDRAKSQKDQYVVWLQLQINLGSHDIEKDPEIAAISPINAGCLFITYSVFEPVTGRTAAEGHVDQPYQPSRCVGGVYHPSPYPDRPNPGVRPPEYTLKQAAREAADRVMTAFHVPLPP